MLRQIEDENITAQIEAEKKALLRRHFMVLGNGGGGTSLLRGLLNAHPQINCQFEHWTRPAAEIAAQIEAWRNLAARSEAKGLAWGNKIPVEQFASRSWEDESILRLSDEFYIIWLQRRFSRYCKPAARSRPQYYQDNWNRAQALYRQMRERHPKRVIAVAFEDLLLRPRMELTRICDFIGLGFELRMFEGTRDTGHANYNQEGINLDKL